MSRCPTIETERLRMRPFREADIDPFLAMMTTSEVRASLRLPDDLDRSQMWGGMASMLGQWELRNSGHWAVELQSTGEFIGRAGTLRPVRPDWPGLEIGWTFHPDHWGCGYATEAGRAAIHWAWANHTDDTLYSLILPDNERSQSVARKLGFTLGETRVMEWYPDEAHGIWTLPRPEWAPARMDSVTDLRDRYIDLLMGCLTRELFLDEEVHDVDLGSIASSPLAAVDGGITGLRAALRSEGWRLTRRGGDPDRRLDGNDWPPTAETMVGRLRLQQVRSCVESVLADGVPGDLIETGVWRGGVTILMRGILEAWADTQRTVWVADSFRGLPTPDVVNYPADAGHDLSDVSTLAVSADQVRRGFERYGLLDHRVRFLEGWFSDTLPAAPIGRLAVLRLDGDLYESTIDALEALYPRLSVGGYVIVDDYGAWEPCRRAVDDYRAAHGISDEITSVDWTGVHWRRSA